jgi:hypothetical protein
MCGMEWVQGDRLALRMLLLRRIGRREARMFDNGLLY